MSEDKCNSLKTHLPYNASLWYDKFWIGFLKYNGGLLWRIYQSRCNGISVNCFSRTVAPVVDQPQTVQAASKTVKSGSLTFHIKKKQIRKSSLKGKKIFVLWVDVTNHGKKAVKSDMLMNYSGVNAYQKVHGKWQELTTGATNSSSLIKGLGKMEHNLKHTRLLKMV